MIERAEVETTMKTLGFSVEVMGGGCTAYSRDNGDGSYTLVTTEGGSSAPESFSDAVNVGTYEKNTEEPVGRLDSFISLLHFVDSERK
jgi:hypothetical protein